MEIEHEKIGICQTTMYSWSLSFPEIKSAHGDDAARTECASDFLILSCQRFVPSVSGAGKFPSSRVPSK